VILRLIQYHTNDNITITISISISNSNIINNIYVVSINISVTILVLLLLLVLVGSEFQKGDLLKYRAPELRILTTIGPTFKRGFC